MSIKEFVELNCGLLKIPCPTVKFSAPSFFLTPTTQACIVGDLDDLNGTELHLNEEVFTKTTPFWKVAVAISHELRHFWQLLYKNGYELLKGYKTSDKADSIKEYNEQELEIDAWAWVCYVMQKFFGEYPTFDFMGNGYTEKVLARAEQIKKES